LPIIDIVLKFVTYEPESMMKRVFGLLLVVMFHLTSLPAQVKRVYSSDMLSSNMFTCIAQDRAGYMWIGTEYGLNKFDGYRFTNYLHDDRDPSSIANNVIVCLLARHNGDVLIGTNKGLQKYDNRTNSFIKFKTPYGEEPRISGIIEMKSGKVIVGTEGYGLYEIDIANMTMRTINKINANNETHYFSELHEDRDGNLWKNGHESYVSKYVMKGGKMTFVKSYPTLCGIPIRLLNDGRGDLILICQHGIMKYMKSSDTLVNMPISASGLNLSDVVFNSGMTDSRGNIFIGSIGKGLFYIPSNTNRLIPFNDPRCSIDMTSADIRFTFQDRENSLWIGCNSKGLIYFCNEKEPFSSWSFTAQNIHVGSSVSHLCQDDRGNVLCTAQDCIFTFDKSGKITSSGKMPAHGNTIYRDRTGNYWISTDNSLFRYFPEKNAWKLEKKLYGIMVNSIADDGHGTLYISTFSKGFCAYNTKSKKMKCYSMLDRNKGKGVLCNDWINVMYVDSSGLLWIGTSAGISCFDPRKETFNTFGTKGILDEKAGISLCENANGNMLIGTDAGLYLFNKSTRKAERFSHTEALRNKLICGIVCDREGNLWCSTTQGIWRYSIASRRLMSYVNGNGLTEREYVKGVYLKGSDGRVFFGTNDGVTTFMPEHVGKSAKRLGSVKLTHLLIGGKMANCTTLSNGTTVTDVAVDESDRFKISYLDNTFTMEFSLLQFSNAENVRFEYRINSADNWTATDEGKNVLEFSHMQPGEYMLEVRAYDNGVFSPIKTYFISITPPWYNSTAAHVIGIALLAALATLGFFLYNRHRHEEMYEEKMRFLINTTHDIRSPLTLILDPLNKLAQKSFDSETDKELNIIDRNAHRILQMVNEILDVRKFDKNQMKLRCEETAMAAYLGNICKNFEFHAKENNIKFSFVPGQDDVIAWIDRINFDKVITNLLSNAFKYTPEGGEIEVLLSTGIDKKGRRALGPFMEIDIVDSGMGLEGTKTDKIFERFYQGDNARSTGNMGTGIGLNLCKMIVDMHHGTISAQNRSDAQGACFTVRIPLGKKHLSGEEMMEEQALADAANTSKKTSCNKRNKVLVVDDDEDMAAYIVSELASYYHFHTCTNGQEALTELLQGNYDIVISDVMMPQMDGLTLVKRIKGNPNISHLPVILLTSKTDIDSRMEGIEKGADAYIAKPFSMEELHLTINNLIKNRLRLKGKFSGELGQKDKMIDKQVTSNDEMLMRRVMESVNRNLSNTDYSIEQLASDVGISRTQLHLRMKEITGVSASSFVRSQRMEQALTLLRERKINLSQIAYTVGFTNEAHFSTVFRKYYGTSPSEYLKNEEKTE
jgi:signal transduction histidine kinase/ligand-binding sensor domain-containing protein/DNA-binding response OmpR family regulator